MKLRCTRDSCAKERDEVDMAYIQGEPYCHPFDSTGLTCYMIMAKEFTHQ